MIDGDIRKREKTIEDEEEVGWEREKEVETGNRRETEEKR